MASNMDRPLTGPEMAALITVGTRVKRGKDWRYGDQVSVFVSNSNG